MGVYFLAILISMFFFVIEELFVKEKKITSYLLIISGITVVSFLAGMRDDTVGIDIITYGNRIFRFSSFIQNPVTIIWQKNTEVEKGYILLNYFISLFTKNFFVFYFALNFITNFIVTVAVFMNRKKYSTSIAMLIYLSTLWLFSLNLLRQSLAVSFVILGFSFFIKDKKGKALFSILIATTFHSSAMLILLFSLFIWIMVYFSRDFHKVLLPFLVCSFYITITLNPVVQNLSKLFGLKYQNYINNGLENSNHSFILLIIIMSMNLLLLTVVSIDNIYISKQLMTLILFTILLPTFIYLQDINYVVFGRVLIYFLIPNVFLLPILIQNLERKIFSMYVCLIVIGYVLVIFYYLFVRDNYGNLFPYTSNLLGF